MKITVCLIFLLQRFAYDKHLQVISSTEKQELEKSTQMHVNLHVNRELHSRFTCSCVLFSSSCFSVEEIT